MTESTEMVSIKIPKWLMPVIVSIIGTLALTVIAWAWKADSRIEKGEAALDKIELIEAQLADEQQQLALLKQEIMFMREDIKEALALLRDSERRDLGD